jgi:hypothetical protein
MSRIQLHELRQNPGMIQALSTTEADQVRGGARVAISISSGSASGSSSTSTSSAYAYSDSTGNSYGYSYKATSENGSPVERKLEKFGNFPQDFQFPDFDWTI